MNSVIVKKDEEVFSKSYAAFVILKDLKSFKIFILFGPNFFCDFIYNLIAKEDIAGLEKRRMYFSYRQSKIFN